MALEVCHCCRELGPGLAYLWKRSRSNLLAHDSDLGSVSESPGRSANQQHHSQTQLLSEPERTWAHSTYLVSQWSAIDLHALPPGTAVEPPGQTQKTCCLVSAQSYMSGRPSTAAYSSDKSECCATSVTTSRRPGTPKLPRVMVALGQVYFSATEREALSSAYCCSTHSSNDPLPLPLHPRLVQCLGMSLRPVPALTSLPSIHLLRNRAARARRPDRHDIPLRLPTRRQAE